MNPKTQAKINEICSGGTDWHASGSLMAEFANGLETELEQLKAAVHDNSVLQNWVMVLPRREQGVVLTAIRGCDLAPKLPLDSPERMLTGWIRWACLNAADPREVGILGAFFNPQFPEFKQSAFGHYPMHWVSHVMHALEVIAYRHPALHVRQFAMVGYTELAHGLHLSMESKNQMVARLSEDRIASGNVVS